MGGTRHSVRYARKADGDATAIANLAAQIVLGEKISQEKVARAKWISGSRMAWAET